MQDDAPGAPRETRLLGKWDFIICAVLGFLATASNRNLTMHGGISQIPAEWVSVWIGSFIGVLAFWALAKWIFRLVKGWTVRLKENRR